MRAEERFRFENETDGRSRLDLQTRHRGSVFGGMGDRDSERILELDIVVIEVFILWSPDR